MENNNKPLTVKDVMAFTGYCRGYIYELIHQGKIPCHKPTGGRIFFKQSEIEEFVYRGRIAADYEIAGQADAILNGEAK